MSLDATSVVPAAFDEIVADSTLIVRGRVTDVRAAVVAGDGMSSFATVAVEAVLKGRAGAFVAVRVPGGQIGRSRVVMAGAPTLRVADHAVFFLARGADGTFRPVGLSMGVYRVSRDAGTGRAVVDPPLVVGVTAPVGRVVRGDVGRRSMPVQEFESLVRLVASRRAITGRAVRR